MLPEDLIEQMRLACQNEPRTIITNFVDYAQMTGNRLPLHRKKRISKKWWAKLEREMFPKFRK